MARGWIRLTHRVGPKAGNSIRIRLTSTTLFFKLGVGRIARSEISNGDRITVKFRMVGTRYVATRVTVTGHGLIRA